MYVQLLAIKKVVVNDEEVTRHPGDWVEVGTQVALAWIAAGDARLPGPDASKVDVVAKALGSGCGVLVRGRVSETTKKSLGLCVRFLEIFACDNGISIPYERTMIWKPPLPVRPWQVLLGFSHLQKEWEVVARVMKEKTLAASIGSEDERRKTQELIGTLRLPVYDTSLVWVRKTSAAEELVRLWQEELSQGADEKHAFLRALYTAVPLICTLPSTWGVAGV